MNIGTMPVRLRNELRRGTEIRRASRYLVARARTATGQSADLLRHSRHNQARRVVVRDGPPDRGPFLR